MKSNYLTIVGLLSFTVALSSLSGQENKVDWDKLEAERYQQILMSVGYYLDREAGELELSTEQERQLVAIENDFGDRFAQIRLRLDTLNKAATNSEITQREFVRRRTALDNSEKKLMVEWGDSIEKTLVPVQVRALKRNAKWYRLTKESENQDEFDVVLLIAKQKGISKTEMDKLSKIVEKAREDFYKQVFKHRQKTEKKVLSLLTPKSRKLFDKIQGGFYDVHSEKVKNVDFFANDDDKTSNVDNKAACNSENFLNFIRIH